jgi:flagellar motor switch protein FliM
MASQNESAAGENNPLQDIERLDSEGQPTGAVHNDAADVVAYDLTDNSNQVDGLPGLEIVTERFAATFRRTLASALRQSVDVKPMSTELILFRDFVQQVPRPTGLFVFRMEPLPGGCAVVVDGHLLLALVDALCGGGNSDLAKAPRMTERDLTQVEHRLLHRLAQPMIEDLAHCWKPITTVRPSFQQIVVRPELSHLADDAEPVFFSVFEIQVGVFTSPLGILLPMSTIGPIKDRLLRVSQVPGDARDQGGLRLSEHVPHLVVELAVEFGRSEMDVRKLLSLEEGDVLTLDSGPNIPLRATVEGATKFLGTPDVSGNTLVFTISRRVT